MEGIYCFIDSYNEEIVYVGKDSNIEKNRRCQAHYWKSKYNDQPINRILQNNKGRYKYKILKKGDFKSNLLNALEVLYIRRYNPKFNFTIGGDGMTKGVKSSFEGKSHSEETKLKISNSKKGVFYSEKSRENMSRSKNTTGYLNVSKRKGKTYTQGFTYVYAYHENGKRKCVFSVNLKQLEEKVKSKGLKWLKFEKEGVMNA